VPSPLESLLTDIDPEPVGEDRFAAIVASGEVDRPSLFGGVVAAQALRAAHGTVDPARRPQSAHMYFLRRGRTDRPLELRVHRDTDGRSFSARRVAVEQEGKPIFTMICSFHTPEDTLESLAPMPPAAPVPEDLPLRDAPQFPAFEVRGHDMEAPHARWGSVASSLWVRTAGRLPDDPIVHDCLLLYISDMGSPWHHEAPSGTTLGPSLDHAIWFHRRTRLDEWHHMSHTRQAAADARGFYTGRIWNRAGVHAASLAQENLLR
jgi:acyl-CoA thioesterase-2